MVARSQFHVCALFTPITKTVSAEKKWTNWPLSWFASSPPILCSAVVKAEAVLLVSLSLPLSLLFIPLHVHDIYK